MYDLPVELVFTVELDESLFFLVENDDVNVLPADLGQFDGFLQ